MSQNSFFINNYVATINGTSNVHEWTQKIGDIWGTCEVKRGADRDVSFLSFKIGMQVNSIKSDDYPMMNDLTFKALKGDKFPEITFNLIKPIDSIPYSRSPSFLVARGRLTIAGVTQEITLPMKFVLENRLLTVEAEQQVKMTEYGVTPPTALFGLVKTGNIITLNFKATFLASN
ncbi:MAG: YceI family protein [Bacteroidota bacterium]|nr:YceI family protein [Bacteroidota bacterium]